MFESKWNKYSKSVLRSPQVAKKMYKKRASVCVCEHWTHFILCNVHSKRHRISSKSRIEKPNTKRQCTVYTEQKDHSNNRINVVRWSHHIHSCSKAKWHREKREQKIQKEFGFSQKGIKNNPKAREKWNAHLTKRQIVKMIKQMNHNERYIHTEIISSIKIEQKITPQTIDVRDICTVQIESRLSSMDFVVKEKSKFISTWKWSEESLFGFRSFSRNW